MKTEIQSSSLVVDLETLSNPRSLSFTPCSLTVGLKNKIYDLEGDTSNIIKSVIHSTSNYYISFFQIKGVITAFEYKLNNFSQLVEIDKDLIPEEFWSLADLADSIESDCCKMGDIFFIMIKIKNTAIIYSLTEDGLTQKSKINLDHSNYLGKIANDLYFSTSKPNMNIMSVTLEPEVTKKNYLPMKIKMNRFIDIEGDSLYYVNQTGQLVKHTQTTETFTIIFDGLVKIIETEKEIIAVSAEGSIITINYLRKNEKETIKIQNNVVSLIKYNKSIAVLDNKSKWLEMVFNDDYLEGLLGGQVELEQEMAFEVVSTVDGASFHGSVVDDGQIFDVEFEREEGEGRQLMMRNPQKSPIKEAFLSNPTILNSEPFVPKQKREEKSKLLEDMVADCVNDPLMVEISNLLDIKLNEFKEKMNKSLQNNFKVFKENENKNKEIMSKISSSQEVLIKLVSSLGYEQEKTRDFEIIPKKQKDLPKKIEVKEEIRVEMKGKAEKKMDRKDKKKKKEESFNSGERRKISSGTLSRKD